MTRLQTLIKEVLSQPKKKDCNCGCNDCGGKAPILTENKVKHLISEGLKHHIDKKISLFESVYRIGSEKHLELIREARALWIRGIIEVSDDDKGLLETHLGHFGLYEGVEVPLDLPMVNEVEKDINQLKNLSNRKERYNYIKNFSKEKLIDIADELYLDYEEYDDIEDKVLNSFGESLNENNLLRQTNLSSEEYQKAKKLKGFNADDYTFSSDNNLYVKKSSLEEKKKAKSKKKAPPLNKPKRGGSKAYYVYVRDPKTKKIKKVSFGSGGLRAKIKNKEARNAFAARHNCKNKTY